MGFKISGLDELRERLERLRPEDVMARALAEQAQRSALRDSVGAQADGLQAAVGSSDPAAVPQELSTAQMLARPFLAPVAAEMGDEVARAVGAAVAAALRGDSPDANGMGADLGGGDLGGNDPPNWSGAGAVAPTLTSNANAIGVGSPRPTANGAPPDRLPLNSFAGPGAPTSSDETTAQQSADLKALLTVREGRRNDVYLDSREIPTLGIGHKILPDDNLKVGDVISDAQVEAFYTKDSKAALDAARSQAIEAGITDPKFIPYLTSVNLQLGSNWRNDFKRTWADIQAGNYAQAAQDAADPKWYRQTPDWVKDFQGALLRLPPKPQ